MHRNTLLEKLERYQLQNPGEAKVVQKFKNFVKSHSDCFNRSLLMGHVTGSSWLLDPSEKKVLLTHHKKLGKWLQLGGHADGECDVLKVAVKEAQEESGIQEIRPLQEEIFYLDVHTIPEYHGVPEHEHYDVTFLLKASKDDFHLSEESSALAWLSADELGGMEVDDSVKKMLKKWTRKICKYKID